MATSKTGFVHGTTIELESAVPEMEGKRVRVVLEAVDELRISDERQRELWQTWADRGPQGPIDDGTALLDVLGLVLSSEGGSEAIR